MSSGNWKMNIKNLRAFVLVVEEGSLVAASEKMALSQPAVSRLINLLEVDFGARLFFRDQRSLVPTPEAELFYPEARRVVSSLIVTQRVASHSTLIQDAKSVGA